MNNDGQIAFVSVPPFCGMLGSPNARPPLWFWPSWLGGAEGVLGISGYVCARNSRFHTLRPYEGRQIESPIVTIVPDKALDTPFFYHVVNEFFIFLSKAWMID